MSRLDASLCPQAVICFVLGLLSPALLFLTGVPRSGQAFALSASLTPATAGCAAVVWRSPA